MLTIGNGARNVWIIGRQHPGETVGSWIVKDFLSLICHLSPQKYYFENHTLYKS